MWTAIDAARHSLRGGAGHGAQAWEQLQVDAVLAAVNGEHASAGGVIVLVDANTLRDGLHERGVCELTDGTPLPVATVRRMACEAEIIPVVLDGAGRVLDVGRAKRLASEAQRQAIMAMHRRCVHPGCEVAVEQCAIHHVAAFETGGATDLANLVPLCEQHHRHLHEHGWTLTMTPDRAATWIRPDGTTWHTGPTITRTTPTAAA